MVVSSVLRTKTKTASVINTERPQGQAQVFRVPGPERRVLVAGAHGVLRAEGMGKLGELPPLPPVGDGRLTVFRAQLVGKLVRRLRAVQLPDVLVPPAHRYPECQDYC
jgi:hypothetical protein